MTNNWHHHFRQFSQNTRRILVEAQKRAEEISSSVNSEHILQALASVPGTYAHEFLRDARINPDQIRLILSLRGPETRSTSGLSLFAKETIARAAIKAAQHSHPKIEPEHLLYALATLPKSLAYQVIQRIGVNPDHLRQAIDQLFEDVAHFESGVQIDGLRSGPPSQANLATKPQSVAEKLAPSSASPSASPALEQFGIDLTQAASQGLLDPMIGREQEITRLIQILSRRTKNNPVLVGDPGVGKTAIVEGLAFRIISNQVPDRLMRVKLYRLDLSLLVAGTLYRGQFEERIKKIVSEVEKNQKIIIFVDEIHMIVGAGGAEGSMDAANIFKPALAKGTLRLIGATTTEEYRRYIERDLALERRLQPIWISEPSVSETVRILKGLKPHYEKYHNVIISEGAVEAAARLADRYIQDRFLPDKAIDLIDEASAAIGLKNIKQNPQQETLIKQIDQTVSLKQDALRADNFDQATVLRVKELKLLAELQKLTDKPKKLLGKVNSQSIAQVVTNWTGIPVDELNQSGLVKLAKIETHFLSHIIGQDDAVKQISKTIRKSHTGLNAPQKPLGSFLFLGPTGVGKTHLAQLISHVVYQDENALIKLDMSEFGERHTLARLIGAPPGYVGYEDAGKLTEAVRRQPYSVVLFDEIEKAHPDIYNILLQILEDGRLTDAKGQSTSFSNTTIVLTSNLGANEFTHRSSMGFSAKSQAQMLNTEDGFSQLEQYVLRQLKTSFKPELINRLDRVIVFKPLSSNDVAKIVKLELDQLAQRLAAEKIKLSVAKNAITLLADVGFDPVMGARTLKRAIADYLEDPLAEMIIKGEIKKGDQIKADRQADRIVISHGAKTKHKPAPPIKNHVKTKPDSTKFS